MGKADKRTVPLQIVYTLLIFFTLAGCGTTIQIQAQRTPTLDTAGIQRIAIMPFEALSRNAVYQNAARYATNVATGKIQATNHFTLVSPTVISNFGARNEGLENYVDALFTGQITRIEEKTITQQGQKKDKETDEIITYDYYVREVEVDFNYSLVRARDGTIIGLITKKGKNSDTQEITSNLASVDSLVNKIIDSQMSTIQRDVAPHKITISRTLERENNKELRKQMDTAIAYVRNGNYRAARQIYLDAWNSHRSVASAVNVSILYEAAGETWNAANFMQQVYSETGSPLARDVLARLNKELTEQTKVEQFGNAQIPIERVAGKAASEVQKALPARARLWIHNNTEYYHSLARDIIDNMTSALVKNGVSVIERQLIDTVIGEQEFHLSGYVNDSNMVRYGNLAGANTVAIVSISGSGAMRRLQIRVLDIESGTVLMQSGTGSEWNL